MSDENKNIKFRWIRNTNQKGEFLFTFDGERVYNLFQDYPHELTAKQKEILEEFKSLSEDNNCQPEIKTFVDKIKDFFK